MSLISKIKFRLKRVHYGLDTRKEFFLSCIDKAIRFTGKKSDMLECSRIHRLRETFRYGDVYRIRDVKLPVMSDEYDDMLWRDIYDDTFAAYVYFEDNYNEEIVDQCNELIREGAYGLINDKVNVTVEPEDIVIDAGSWAGDFAAYASMKGARVYAFEPTDATFVFLEKTAELNGNIIPVKKGLSDENTSAKFLQFADNTGANRIATPSNSENFSGTSSTVETITLDDFVRENNLPRVDFIKADIEGFERHMLAGAQETLARFAPKLALCTYHLPDDPQVMAELILKANPKYNIVQKRMKLFASVPE